MNAVTSYSSATTHLVDSELAKRDVAFETSSICWWSWSSLSTGLILLVRSSRPWNVEWEKEEDEEEEEEKEEEKKKEKE